MTYEKPFITSATFNEDLSKPFLNGYAGCTKKEIMKRKSGVKNLSCRNPIDM